MAVPRTHFIDDDGTLMTGTIWNDAEKQRLYDQIDAGIALGAPSANLPFFNVSGPTALRTFGLPDADATILVSLTTPAIGDLFYAGSASGSLSRLAIGAAGTVLVGGATPAWSASPSLTSIGIGAATIANEGGGSKWSANGIGLSVGEAANSTTWNFTTGGGFGTNSGAVQFQSATSGSLTLSGSAALIANAGYYEGTEMTPPGVAAATKGRLYFDTSGGKTRLMVIFSSGAAQVVATQP